MGAARLWLSFDEFAFLPVALASRHTPARHRRDMVHEPYLAFGEGSWKQNGVAAVHRLMTMVLLSAARRVWMSIPAWEASWRPYALGRPLSFHWLPVASNIPVIDDPARVELFALVTRPPENESSGTSELMTGTSQSFS